MRITDQVMSYDWEPIVEEHGLIDLGETFADFLDGYDTGDMDYGDWFKVQLWDGAILVATAEVELSAYSDSTCRIAEIRLPRQ